jgi:hypothetical protein
MPERWQPDEDELARSLRGLGDELDYPAGAGIASAVRARLDEAASVPSWQQRLARWIRPTAGARGRRAWQPVAAAIALVLTVFIGSLVAFPTVRETVADWLGLRGIGITIVPSLSPLPTRHGALALGAPMSLEQARATVDWPILVPDDPALGPPDEVYVDRTVLGGGAVSLVWSARPGYPAASTTGAGLLITELKARIDERYFQKVLGPGTTVERVHVGAAPGYWISGEPHELIVVDARGDAVFQQVRLAGDVLMWEAGDVTVRVESALTRDDAIRLGSSIH